MPNEKVVIEITVKGPVASGKSLAMSDMVAGLKDKGHFHVRDILVGNGDNFEHKMLEARLRYEMTHPIEHEDDHAKRD